MECHKELGNEIVYNKITTIEGQMRSCYDSYVGTKMGNGLRATHPAAYQDKAQIC